MRFPFPALSLAAAVFLAGCDDPAMLEPEMDCSSPWPDTGNPLTPYQLEVHESDLPYDLAKQGITITDRVSVKYDNPRADGTQRPQRVIAYTAGVGPNERTWMLSTMPGGIEWFGQGHLVEIIEASRPGCTDMRGAALLLFQGAGPSG